MIANSDWPMICGMNISEFYWQLSDEKRAEISRECGHSLEYLRRHVFPKQSAPDRIPRPESMRTLWRLFSEIGWGGSKSDMLMYFYEPPVDNRATK